MEPFAAATDPPVRGTLHRATGDDVLVLAHGAGSNHDAPLLRALAHAFVERGVSVLRCDLPYRQAHPKGPPSPAGAERDRRGLARALETIGGARGRRFIGGHSYGGRQASMLLAESPAVAHALLLLSYPLHPPGKPDRLRTQHLPGLRVPTLFVHGARDPFGTLAEIEAARALIPSPSAVLPLPRAAHVLHADSATSREVVEALFRLIG
jgi:predicted alpha/beta-hydrolase family hydrolase